MTISNNELNLKNLPTLSEVILVEEALQNAKGSTITTYELKKILKGKISKNTLMVILDYLKATNKITITSKGIVWINGTKKLLKLLDKLLEKSELTEEDAILFGRQITKKAAKRFRERTINNNVAALKELRGCTTFKNKDEMVKEIYKKRREKRTKKKKKN